MTTRRQALRSPGLLATSALLALILLFSCALPSIPARAEPVSSGDDGERVIPDAMQGAQNFPVMPLTVVPKPDVHPLTSFKVEDANQQLAILVLALLSPLTFIVWRFHRRDYASPRRNGRRI